MPSKKDPNRVACCVPTRAGGSCPRFGTPDNPFCVNHDPKLEVQRRIYGTLRAPKPVEKIGSLPESPYAERPRTLAGITDAALDIVALVKAGGISPAIADVALRGLKVAAERLEKAEERKRPQRAAASGVPSSGGATQPSATAPASTLIGDMVAARKGETETVQ